MRIVFNQGVPEGCFQWLQENVGRGNIFPDTRMQRGRPVGPWIKPRPEHDWYYNEKLVSLNGPEVVGLRYVPTITIKDAIMATLFALKWEYL